MTFIWVLVRGIIASNYYCYSLYLETTDTSIIWIIIIIIISQKYPHGISIILWHLKWCSTALCAVLKMS